MRLLVQFDSSELADFRWALLDESAGSALLDWQAADEDRLAAVAAENPHPVVFVIPQQSVYLTQVELPERAGRQVLSAIEFQVEDRLAQDIESQHFALGDTSANPISVAVVEREIMRRALALAQGLNLRLVRIVPELFLCPWPGDGVALTEGDDGCLLRYGDYRGLKCNAQALPAMLALIASDLEFDRITYYAHPGDPTPALEGYTVERVELDDVASGLVAAPLIDLQQRDFQLSSPWRSLGRAWKWVGILLAALVLVFGYNRAVALQELEAELAAVKQQQYELLRPYLPDASLDDDLKRLLIRRLGELQANRLEQGFLKLLLDFTRARANYPAVEISRIGYQDNRLSVDISSSKLTDIEAMLEAVRQQGANARLDSLNIKPEQSSGQLVLEGDADG